DYPQPIAKAKMKPLGDPKTGFAGVDSDWEVVSDQGKVSHKTPDGSIVLFEVIFGDVTQRGASGITADPNGQIYFSDRPAKSIYRIGLDGNVSTFAEDEASPSGLGFGPNGDLYVCESQTGRIVAFTED